MLTSYSLFWAIDCACPKNAGRYPKHLSMQAHSPTNPKLLTGEHLSSSVDFLILPCTNVRELNTEEYGGLGRFVL